MLDELAMMVQEESCRGRAALCPATNKWEVTGLTGLRRQLVLDVEEGGGELGHIGG